MSDSQIKAIMETEGSSMFMSSIPFYRDLFVLNTTVNGFLASLLPSETFMGISVTFVGGSESDIMTKPFAVRGKMFEGALIDIIHAGMASSPTSSYAKVILNIERPIQMLLTKKVRDASIQAVFETLFKKDGYSIQKTSGETWFIFKTAVDRLKCVRVVEIDMLSLDSKNERAVRFLDALASDLSLCRGQPWFVKQVKSLLTKEISLSSPVVFVMFSEKVEMADWWSLENVPLVCAVISATIIDDEHEESMYLDAICSRTDASGAAAMLINKVADIAREKYLLERLTLTPANPSLMDVYQRKEYGFRPTERLYILERPLNEQLAGETDSDTEAPKPSKRLKT